MEVHERADGLVVVNDAYNANPDSMVSALETLARMGERAGGAPSPCSARCASSVRAPTTSTARSVPWPTGSASTSSSSSAHGARGIRDALVEERGEDGTTRHVDTVEGAGEWLRENVAGPDVVLVKASRAGRLERVAEMLLGQDPGTDVGEESGA